MGQLQLIENKFKLKEMELNALLEITQAINSNLPEEALFKIFNFTLRANLSLKKLALFVLDSEWKCKVNFGTMHNFTCVALESRFAQLRAVTRIENDESPFKEFDFVIPVFHKNNTLALVFVDEQEDMGTESSNFIQALSNIIVVAIENKKMARAQLQQEAFRKELEIASDVQQFLFPDQLPNNEEINVEASYLPHHRVGGDYYDFINMDADKFLLCIADVSGKGIPAAILMSNFQASLRTMARQTQDLEKIVKELNFQLLQNSKGEKFITFFCAIYDKTQKKLQYINAGHNPPLLIQDGQLKTLSTGTTLLGVFHPLPFIKTGAIEGLEKFLLFNYTDGVTETENEEGEEFGEERLNAYFEKNATKNLSSIHQDIIVDLDTFKGNNGYKDDITMLSCRVK